MYWFLRRGGEGEVHRKKGEGRYRLGEKVSATISMRESTLLQYVVVSVVGGGWLGRRVGGEMRDTRNRWGRNGGDTGGEERTLLQ